MLRIFELDSKEFEGTIFTVDVGDEKCGVTRQELIELVAAKHLKAQGRRQAQRKAASVAETSADQVQTLLVSGEG